MMKWFGRPVEGGRLEKRGPGIKVTRLKRESKCAVQIEKRENVRRG